jgi:hypothetical protein
MPAPPLYVVKSAAVGRHDELKAAEALSDGMDRRGRLGEGAVWEYCLY